MREDVRRARETARAMIFLVVLIVPLTLFLWIAQPGHMGGDMFDDPPWYEAVLPWAGWAVYLSGLAWMIRIYRTSHLEPDTSSWRYRDL